MNPKDTTRVRSLPTPDTRPRFLRRAKDLSPRFLFPNTPEALTQAVEEYEDLEVSEEGYLQTFLLAQLVEGLGELVADNRALRIEIRRLRADLVAARRVDAEEEEEEEEDDEEAGDDFGDEEPVEPEVIVTPDPERVTEVVVPEPVQESKPKRERRKKKETP